jgi:hypothetical protein
MHSIHVFRVTLRQLALMIASWTMRATFSDQSDAKRWNCLVFMSSLGVAFLKSGTPINGTRCASFGQGKASFSSIHTRITRKGQAKGIFDEKTGIGNKTHRID